MTGFKTYTNEGIQLGSGQTVRQTFTLEVGTVEESVTVAGEAPLIETATSSQATTLGTQEVRELPVNRRNISNLLSLAPGVNMDEGDVQMSGVAGGGTGITVDGTEANSSPEERSMNQYGSQNQISIMSIDSIAEVQIIKGVLPAEYGGVAGGQVNMISRSGTNMFHGSVFYNLQNERFNARNFFSTTAKPVGTFNQYGGTLGGPVLRNKLFFFTTYEGYYEDREVILTGSVPYQNVRDALPAAFPSPRPRSTSIRFRCRPSRSSRTQGSSIRTAERIAESTTVPQRESRRRQSRLCGVQWREFRDDLHAAQTVHRDAENQLERLERSVLSERTGSHRFAVCHGPRVPGFQRADSAGTARTCQARRVFQCQGPQSEQARGVSGIRSSGSFYQHHERV